MCRFFKSQKKNHGQSVPYCKNLKNGECKYGNEYCWFKHADKENWNDNENNKNENNENKNEEFMLRIFKMMETLTERIVEIEARHISI